MTVSKALIIADPWIGMILNGSKIWEMRSTGAAHRGWFGLIAKGTGAVHGVARLADVLPPLSPDEMLATIDKHRIPAGMITSGEVARWNTPWVLADVRRLPTPVPYRHRPGAVTWVTLDPEVSAAIAAQMPDLPTTAPARQARQTPAAPRSAVPTQGRPFPEPAAPAGNTHGNTAGNAVATPCPSDPVVLAAEESGPGTPIGSVELTEGNIRNNHIYLRGILDRFPADAIGGGNAASKAPRALVIDWGGDAPAMTDIDGTKKIFRARGWIRSFFERTGARPGDRAHFEQTGPHAYRVSLSRQDPA
ncbi:hypothetical protein LV82_01609 [Albidovulum inexpectatum]|uniref:ASCH domain-containing protein n=1 Tax=Albidovulum inexpectatum TaxID=196587 RepID=A0A2S5JH82_9RHOB|nr:hypothetical protein [Albidovulum inexpectatum]PPB80876.1 hypothetical protein LV82_01609 [Albidovulum inexpectatum]